MAKTSLTNWKEMIEFEMKGHQETFEDVVECTLSEEQLIKNFDCGYGGTEGEPFTAWTTNRVYFPICYDGAEWVESVSRNPDGKPTHHFGGG